MRRWSRGLVVAATLGVPGWAIADTKHSTPAPAPAPVAPTPPPLPDKPNAVWSEGDCSGSMVFLDNKSWRECCLLCAVGDDRPSSVEKQAAKQDHEKIVVTNYFSLAGSNRSNRGGDERDGDGDEPRSRKGGDSKREESLHRRYRFGIPALKSLSPSLGGSESR